MVSRQSFHDQLQELQRDVERVGDHATNLGEWTVYMVTGELRDMNP